MLVLLLPLVAAILLFSHFQSPAEHSDKEQKYAFIIESAPTSTAKCERFETRLLPHGKVNLYLLRDSTKTLPAYGDTIVARTQIEWFYTTGRAFAAKYLVLPAADHTPPLQTRLYNRLKDAGLSGHELATVGALTLGYKEDLDPALKHHFQASGAAHVLAVSGLHTGILYGLLIWLFTLGGRLKPGYENRWGRCSISLIIIAVMWFYAWLTGLTPSVVRAVLMVTIFETGRMLYREAFSINTIAAAAVLILLIRPSDLQSVSFQLSFAATFSIVLAAKQMETFLHRSKWLHSRRGRLYDYVIGTIVVSLAAQIGTLPITMYYFGQVSSYFLLTNLIVLPLAFLLVPFGFLSVILGGSGLGLVISKVTYGLSWLMNHSVAWIESLPGSSAPAHINEWMIAVYYALLLLFYALVVKKP